MDTSPAVATNRCPSIAANSRRNTMLPHAIFEMIASAMGESYPTTTRMKPFSFIRVVLETICGERVLSTNGRRIVQEVITRATCRVVRIAYLSCRWTRRSRAVVSVFGVAQESLIVSAATLPANAARATSDRSIATIAVPVMQASCRSNQAGCQAKKHHCALHLRHPLRNHQRPRRG